MIEDLLDLLDFLSVAVVALFGVGIFVLLMGLSVWLAVWFMTL